MDSIIKFGFGRVEPGFQHPAAFIRGENLFQSDHVQDVEEKRSGGKVTISAKVVRQTTVSERYSVVLELDDERVATKRWCRCPAGAAGKCKHIAALILFINAHDGASKTSRQQEWGKPSSNSVKNHKELREKYSKATKQVQPLMGETFEEIELAEPMKLFCEQNVFISLEEAEHIMIETLLQSQGNSKKWFARRNICISASQRAHRILVCRKGNKYTDYGNRNESVARDCYRMINNANVVPCGLIVHILQPWLCCSPDGIVLNAEGNPLKILEIKCPYKCSNKPIILGDEINVDFLCCDSEKVIKLKRSHCYYTQCQTLLYVSGLDTCDLFVWSPQQQITVEVKRDEEFLA
ncbi:hypothetical protein B566_EDAN004015, partial [Ephemera danica]